MQRDPSSGRTVGRVRKGGGGESALAETATGSQDEEREIKMKMKRRMEGTFFDENKW